MNEKMGYLSQSSKAPLPFQDGMMIRNSPEIYILWLLVRQNQEGWVELELEFQTLDISHHTAVQQS